MNPRVTVCILSHRARFLPDAVASVLSQTIYEKEDVQLIVQHCKKNWPSKLNSALKAAIGEFIVILCDDDLLAPNFLERVLATAARGKGADIVYTDRICFQDGTRPEDGIRHREHGLAYMDDAPDRYYVTQPPAEFFELGATLPMTMLCRRSLWEKLGGYDEHMPHADTEFFARAGFEGARMHYLPEPVFWYREHAGQYSKELRTSMDDFLVAYHRKHFLRFGLPFDTAKKIVEPETGADGITLKKGWWKVYLIPPAERMKYALDHYPEYVHAVADVRPFGVRPPVLETPAIPYARLELQKAA